MKWIKRLYIIFLGIILSVTTGFGLAAFYPEPTPPTYPYRDTPVISESCYQTPANQATPACQKEFEKQKLLQQQQQEEEELYQNKSAGYTRTAIFFGIAIGTIFALLGIIFIKESMLVANGMLLGAVLTALFTRFLISLASLGSSTTSTIAVDTVSYVEFGILLILSTTVILVGLLRLRESDETSQSHSHKK